MSFFNVLNNSWKFSRILQNYLTFDAVCQVIWPIVGVPFYSNMVLIFIIIKYSTLIFNSFYVSIVLTVKFKNSIRVNKTITSILTKYCQCSTFLNILSNNNEIDGRFDAKPSKELAFAKPVPRKLQSQLSNSMVVYIMQECTFEGQTFQIPLVRSDAKSSTN